ncbi:DUF695 domain-containing protein [Actinocatenispora sera]|uniref:DUF695 domain-containing protein n=1 Tax=Actinocatenispora sera TaxID=390989 RepID=A0A810L1D8_9ACTN|nr:DUF695 domain-containing protein [Actinocatenispora sera]BCJ29017.1 hypothetical protein Asera_31250 [Actinocatenispora sera]
MPLFRRNKPSWEPDWQTFPGRVPASADRPEADAMLHADLAAVAAAPVAELPVRLTVRVAFGATRPDGSPAAGAAHQLYVFEDKLAAEVAKRADGQYVGRVISAGECTFVFQLPAEPGELKLPAGPELATGPAVPVQHVEADPDWSYARAVFTKDPAAEQRSYNRPLVAALVARGDRAEIPRPIEHSAHFADQAGAGASGKELGALGYRVTASTDPEGGVTLTAVRAAPLTAVDEASVQVQAVVQAHGGDYDGWGSDLVR